MGDGYKGGGESPIPVSKRHFSATVYSNRAWSDALTKLVLELSSEEAVCLSAAKGRTELLVFDRGSVTRDCYSKQVILPHVRLFCSAIGPKIVFMDDNSRPNQTSDVEQLLEAEDITRNDRLVFSHDLNPI
ncbi:transposable element Tcb2 transposase [Trichonephila clavipes]|nr:transposable element Tcb2 transposase [Trichonephila clavipes]